MHDLTTLNAPSATFPCNVTQLGQVDSENAK